MTEPTTCFSNSLPSGSILLVHSTLVRVAAKNVSAEETSEINITRTKASLRYRGPHTHGILAEITEHGPDDRTGLQASPSLPTPPQPCDDYRRHFHGVLELAARTVSKQFILACQALHITRAPRSRSRSRGAKGDEILATFQRRRLRSLRSIEDWDPHRAHEGSTPQDRANFSPPGGGSTGRLVNQPTVISGRPRRRGGGHLRRRAVDH